MDKRSEKSEKSTQPTASTSPATTNPVTTTTTTTSATTSNNGHITSESSESLESWTLVNKKEESAVKDDLDDERDNHIDTFKDSDNDEEEDATESEQESETETETETEPEPELEPETEPEPEFKSSANDDLSDGISVISESESVGRISPHPEIGEYIEFCVSEMGNELRQRRSRFSSESDAVSLRRSSQTVIPSSGVVSLVKRGFKVIFLLAMFLGVGLALLGFIGNILNPPWKPHPRIFKKSSPDTSELMRKIGSVELRNEFLSQKIDSLNEKVKHLSALNDLQQQKPANNEEHKKSKTFEAWPGNGDSLQPVDITKKDLEDPYESERAEYEKLQKRRKNWPTEPQKIMTWFLRQGKRFNTFEEVDAELRKLQDYDYIIEQFNFLNEEYQKEENKNVNKLFEPSQDTHANNNSKEKKDRKDYSKERTSKDMNESKENSNQNESKKDYNKQKHKHAKKHAGDFSGEWQDNYMKHRDQQRKQSDYKYQNNKNWYTRRGDSRENQRSGEKKYR